MAMDHGESPFQEGRDVCSVVEYLKMACNNSPPIMLGLLWGQGASAMVVYHITFKSPWVIFRDIINWQEHEIDIAFVLWEMSSRSIMAFVIIILIEAWLVIWKTHQKKILHHLHFLIKFYQQQNFWKLFKENW